VSSSLRTLVINRVLTTVCMIVCLPVLRPTSRGLLRSIAIRLRLWSTVEHSVWMISYGEQVDLLIADVIFTSVKVGNFLTCYAQLQRGFTVTLVQPFRRQPLWQQILWRQRTATLATDPFV
jgi:hypothetical protein